MSAQETISPSTTKQKKSFRKKLLIFLSVFVVILLVIFLRLAWIAAATGLVSVPVFSSYAYEELKPTREVSGTIDFQSYLSEALNTLVTNRLQSGRGALQDRSISLLLPEEILTKGLQQALKEKEIPSVQVEKSQLLVEENGSIELFLPVIYKERGSALRLSLFVTPTEEGELAIDLQDMWLGAWHVPKWLAQRFAKEVLAQAVIDLNEKIGRYLSIKKIDWSSGELTAHGELTIQVRPFDQFPRP